MWVYYCNVLLIYLTSVSMRKPMNMNISSIGRTRRNMSIMNMNIQLATTLIPLEMYRILISYIYIY